MNIYYDRDADLGLICAKRVAVIGYGSQGFAHANNLRETGVDLLVGLREGSPSWAKAEAAGHKVVTTPEAAAAADIVMILVPDELHGEMYAKEIRPHLRSGNALAVAHGFSIHFGQVVPPAGVDCFMVAPKAPGHLVRHEFTKGAGVPMLVAVHQDATGRAKEMAIAYAAAIGGGRAGIIETTFREETETDLFGEQVVLCGGITALMTAAYETLVAAGYSPEMAYFECLHEVKLIVDLIYEGGISTMRYSVSNTAQYGDLTRGPRVIDGHVRAEMRHILDEIQSGRFAREWILENRAGRPVFNALTRRGEEHEIEQVGQRLRAMMPWLARERLVDRTKN